MRSPEQGSGTVLMLGALLVLLSVAVAALHLATASLGAHRARTAADLGALAGARVLQLGTDPAVACARAEEIARLNGASAATCTGEAGGIVDVSTAVDLPAAALPGVPGQATARARAGPVIR